MNNKQRVEYIDHMGDDLSVVRAARVSFAADKEAEWQEKDAGLIRYLAKHDHWCYDDQTEIITDKGWKLFSALEKSDLVGQVSGWEDDSFKLEFVAPDAYHTSYYEGDMITVDNERVNYSVTPRHKMLWKKRSSSGWGSDWATGTSDDLFGKQKKMQQSAGLVRDGDDLKYAQGQYLGFVLGDGYKPKDCPSIVAVRLKVSRKVKYLKGILDLLGKEYTCPEDKHGVYNFRIKDGESVLYTEKPEKCLDFGFCLQQGADFCYGVLDGLLNSDGSKKRKTWTFSSSSRNLFDGFCNIASVCGYNVKENAVRHLENTKHRDNYRAMLQTREQCIVNDSRAESSKEELRPYAGEVHCVTVPSGMLLVRRKGVQLVCGNTPTAHTAITLRMTAPVPIRTQCFKHKQGFVENEESRRYISCTPEYFLPEFREVVEHKKQGSGVLFDGAKQEVEQALYEDHMKESVDRYEAALARGVCEEQARFYLPQGIMVNWYWTGSLAAYARFAKQRLDSHAQVEIQELAKMVSDIITPLFPVSWAALMQQGEK